MKLIAMVCGILLSGVTAGAQTWGERKVLAVDPVSAFEFEAIRGQVSDSTFADGESTPTGEPAVRIDYVMNQTTPGDEKHPDFVGRDMLQLTRKVEPIDISSYSYLTFDMKGDGSPHNLSITLRDGAGRQVRYGIFYLTMKDWYRFEVVLSAPFQNSGNFDFTNVVEFGLLVDEGGENRYVRNAGALTVGPITVSHADEERKLARQANFLTQQGTDVSEVWNDGKPVVSDIEKIQSVLQRATNDYVGTWRVGIERLSRRVPRASLGFAGEVGSKVVLTSARHEYESAQIVVLAGENPVTIQTVQMSKPLTDDKGHVIATVSIHPVEYVKAGAQAEAPPREVGEFEDILLPMQPRVIAAEQVQPYLLTVYTPAGTPAGIYRGEAEVIGDDERRETVDIELTVHPFTLPIATSLPRQHLYWPAWTARWFGYDDKARNDAFNGTEAFGIPKEMLLAHLDFLLKYRLEIMNIGWLHVNDLYTGQPRLQWPFRERLDGRIDFTTFDEVVQFCLDRGQTRFSMSDIHRDIRHPQVQKWLTEYVEHLKEKGWLDKVYVKVIDEPYTEYQYTVFHDQIADVHKLDPRIKTLAALPDADEQAKDIDIWNWRGHRWDDAFNDRFRKLNDKKEVWWYWTCCPYGQPYPNYFYFCPQIDPRAMEWMHWACGTEGYLFWAVNWWGENNLTAEKRFPQSPWNAFNTPAFQGDGVLVYPGPDGTLLSSIRLENMRDGTEDYEYLALAHRLCNELRDKADPKWVREVEAAINLKTLMPTIEEYPHDDQPYLDRRAELARLIAEALQWKADLQ